MTSLFPPFNRRSSFRKQPYFYEAGRGVNYKSTGGPFPTLDLNFLSGTLDPRITFSRASNATLTDSTGKITYAPNNLLLQSQTFQTTWSASATTVSADSTTAPDGTTTADTLLDTAVNNIHYISQSITTYSPATRTYISSVYAKASTLNYITVGITDISVGDRYAVAVFNLSNGTVSTSGASGTGYAVSSPTITSVGSGWYRCSVVCTAGTTVSFLTGALGANKTGVITATSGGFESYLGNGSGVFIWGAQLEAVTYQTTPSTYNATTTAAYYGPRFDYDPATLSAKGLLIEEARTNLAIYSEQFDNTSWWLKLGSAGSAVAANQTTAPDGTSTADKFSVGTGSGTWYIANYIGPNLTSGQAYTFSVYLKPAGYNFAFIRPHNNSTALGQSGFIVDLTTGAITYPSSGATPTSTGTATSVGNGWWRVTATSTANATTTTVGGPGIWPCPNNSFANATGQNPANFTGDGTSGLFLWGAQFETGAFATSYLPTVASSVARSADIATMTGTNFSSWFNQGPVNLLLYSEQFDNAYWDVKLNSSITANATTAPNSTLTADKLVENTATGQHWVGASSPAITITSGVAYTISIYAKQSERGYFQLQGDAGAGRLTTGAVFNLTNGTVFSTAAGATASITDVGNGWYRCAVTATASGTGTAYPYIGLRQNSAPASASYLGDGTSGLFIWGAQFEVGSTATTYIPTTTVPVASPPAVGTLFEDCYWNGTSGYNYIPSVNDGSVANIVSITTNGGQANARIRTGSADVFNIGLTPALLLANKNVKNALAFATNDFAYTANGQTPSTGSSGAAPAVSQLWITAISGSNGSKTIRSIKYYPTRLPNTQLVSLTQPSLTPSMQLVFDTSSTSFTDANWSP